MQTIISQTGRAHGFGSMPYRWVSKLTAAERAHVKNGTAIVKVRPDVQSRGRSPLYFVTYAHGRFGHTVVQ